MSASRAVEVKLLDPRFGDEWPLPAYATEASAGMDLRAALDAPLMLEPGDAALVPSGIALHLIHRWPNSKPNAVSGSASARLLCARARR